MAKGINQYELAENLGCMQCQISQFESGKVKIPHLPIIVHAAEYFDCKLEELILVQYPKK